MSVVMTHPKLDGEERAVTTQEAFDEVWSDKGFVLVTDEPAVAEEPKTKPAQALVTDSKIGA
jgi:hypothetical protein